MIISVFTLLFYFGISLRIAYAKRIMKDIKLVKRSRNEAETNGLLSKYFPYNALSHFFFSELMFLLQPCTIYISP